MISKNEIKYIQSLSDKKTRDHEGVFVAEGVKIVDEFVQNEMGIKKIYATDEWTDQHKDIGNVTAVSIDQLKKISHQTTPNHVVAIVAQKKLTEEPEVKNNVILVLDGIQDPGNLGTIIRIADWFGIRQIVASNDTADVYNSKVVQASMGSVVRVNVWYKNLEQWLAAIKTEIYGALLKGESVFDLKKITEGILVIGNESKGIRQTILPCIKRPVTIPKKGGAESLNAAVATGIILSHLLKE
jgi:TrmH family RNA methyltransferase